MNNQLSLFLSLTLGLLVGWFANEYLHVKTDHQYRDEKLTQFMPVPEIQQSLISDERNNKVESIQQLLNHKAFLQAVDHYETLQAHTNSALMLQARSEILSHAQQLLKKNNFVSAVELLQAFLVASFRDIDARLLLVEAYLGQRDYLTAIEQLYEARGMAYRSQMLTLINHRIRQIAAEQAELYRKNSDKAGLLSLYQNLTQKEPDYSSWFIELALAQLALDNPHSAQNSLALVTSDPDVGEQARALLLKLQQSIAVISETPNEERVTDIKGIPLSRRGQSFLVEARLQNRVAIQLLIDTGASMTVITPDVLKQQGIRYQNTGDSRVFNTANGAIRAPVYILDSLTVGDWSMPKLEVGVLELEGFDGLLGMNFLRHFRFFIDQHESMLRLSPNKNQPD